MSTAARTWMGRSLAAALLLAAWPGLAAADGPDENLNRVRAMSREDRARLAKALDRFDTLPGDRKEAIRTLDAGLAGLEPEARGRLLAVLRRYHVFYKNLPEEKRTALDAADPAKKLDLIAAYRAEQAQAPTVARTVADGVQVSALSPVRLRPLARELIVYFSLDPVADAKERTEFARKKTPAERRAYTTQLIQSKAFAERDELRDRLREEDSEFQVAEQTVLKNPILAGRLKRGEQEQSRFEPAKKKADGGRAKDGAAKPRDALKQLVQKLDEQQILREFDAQTVEPLRLEGFEAALPPWARQSLDDLPPDAARRRLKALYRLVFPSPAEFQPPKTPEPSQKSNRPEPPAEDGQGTPF